MNRASNLLGVVLVGGKSSRMGSDKAAIRSANDVSFLMHATSRFDALGIPVVVSGRCSVGHQRTVVNDLVDDAGPISGIAACLQHAATFGFAACVVTPVDTPKLDSIHLERLIDTYRQRSIITVAKSDRLEPLIAVYPTEHLAALAQSIELGQRSLYRWIKQRIKQSEYQTVCLPVEACHNMNTPEDLS